MKGVGVKESSGETKGDTQKQNKNVLFLWGQQFFPRFKIKKRKTKEKQDGLPEENKHQKRKSQKKKSILSKTQNVLKMDWRRTREREKMKEGKGILGEKKGGKT